MILYAITDRKLHPRGDLLEQASSVMRGGADWVQVREKDLPDLALFQALKMLSSEARRLGATLLLNGRPDIAALAGAGGVHLPAEGLPVAVVRREFPRPFLVVRSCHGPTDVMAAAEEGADAVTLGPVFATPSKLRYGAPLGLPALADACRRSSVPVIAIGGIGEEQLRQVREAGAAGAAAIRLFCAMKNPIAGIPALRGRQ